jgi:hypothetical protein
MELTFATMAALILVVLVMFTVILIMTGEVKPLTEATMQTKDTVITEVRDVPRKMREAIGQ